MSKNCIVQICSLNSLKSIKINSNKSLQDFFKEIRTQFSPNFPTVNKQKLIFFNGIPPKKLREIDLEPNKTLEEIKVYNNSMLRILIDEENILNFIDANSSKDCSNEKIPIENSNIKLNKIS